MVVSGPLAARAAPPAQPANPRRCRTLAWARSWIQRADAFAGNSRVPPFVASEPSLERDSRYFGLGQRIWVAIRDLRTQRARRRDADITPEQMHAIHNAHWARREARRVEAEVAADAAETDQTVAESE